MKDIEKRKQKFGSEAVVKNYDKKLKYIEDIPKHCPPGVYIIASCRGGAKKKTDVMAQVIKSKVLNHDAFKKYQKNLFKTEPINNKHPLMKPGGILKLPKQFKMCEKYDENLSPNNKYLCLGK